MRIDIILKCLPDNGNAVMVQAGLPASLRTFINTHAVTLQP
jgi:hypothetical protein